MSTIQGDPSVSTVQADEVDFARMHRERLARAQRSLGARGIAAALLFNPLNVRYVSYPGVGTISSMVITFRWALVPAEGEIVLWDLLVGSDPGEFGSGGTDGAGDHEAAGTSPGYFTGEVRPVRAYSYFPLGDSSSGAARTFADEIVSVLGDRGLKGEKLAIDRADGAVFVALTEAGVEICDGQPAIEQARSVKTVDELAIMRQNARVAGAGLDAMRARMEPGVTENELWATLMGSVMSNGAEWSDSRLLSSGQRTNPWMQEATDRKVQSGELVGLDTDMAGRYGYFVDVSRTYLCGDVAPTDDQRRLYQAAYEFVQGNVPDMKVGASYAELGERMAARFPSEYYDQRYLLIGHGVGMCDEYPAILWDGHHEGEVEAGMAFSLEAYCGVVGGREGVKLEEQLIVTESGPEVISTSAPHEERLLAS